MSENNPNNLIEIPAALEAALKQDPEAKLSFESLAFSHRREYVNWINEAKQEKTRLNRVMKTITMLKTKQR